MRDAELVVTYLPMPGLVDATGDLAGVFKCSQDVDDSFAASEPPAHDKWEPEGMNDRTQKSHVTVALTRIEEAWDKRFGATGKQTPKTLLGAKESVRSAR